MKGLAALLAVAVLAAAGCASASGGGSGGGNADKSGSGSASSAPADAWAGTGFSVWELDGRWWVFREGSRESKEFLKGVEPGKQATRIGAGPGGQTLKSPDVETLQAFAAWRPGFAIRWKGGRIWIFREKARELAEYDKGGELAKTVTRIGDGPDGATIIGPDAATLDAWAAAK